MPEPGAGALGRAPDGAILPTHSLYVVFTLPSALRALAMHDREAVVDMLFASAAEALIELGRDVRRLGVTSVLSLTDEGLRHYESVAWERAGSPASRCADR
ncbi:hypothetical protein WME73_01225 [Sorangium sp. So ce302]|uniref:hypothetical protein n=1 Tax=unclassified Sorangium TaxID=2621164 RepID=UPI003F5DE6CB